MQNYGLPHLRRQPIDRVPDKRGIDFVVDAVFGRLIRQVRHLSGIQYGLVRLPADFLRMQMREYLAHPCEEGRLLKVVVYAVNNDCKSVVDEFLRIALVMAKAAGKGHQPGFVFGFEPPCPAFAILPYFFNNGHAPLGY